MISTYSNLREKSSQTVRQVTRTDNTTNQIPTSTTISAQQEVKQIWARNPQHKICKTKFQEPYVSHSSTIPTKCSTIQERFEHLLNNFILSNFSYIYRVIKKSLCTWWLQYRIQMHREFLITLYNWFDGATTVLSKFKTEISIPNLLNMYTFPF
jgi:hypothetical protein